MNYINTKNIIFIFLIGAFCCFSEAADTVVKQFNIEPFTQYQLSFIAETPEKSSWKLEIYNDEGLLPYEGVFDFPWHQIIVGKKKYVHRFRSPSNGTSLKFIIKNRQVKVSNINLEKIKCKNLLVNGKFELGSGNYSGWSTYHKGAIQEITYGKRDYMAFVISKGGFMLTDLIPVVPGATYRISPKSSCVSQALLLGYSSELLRTHCIKLKSKKKPLIIPEDVYYLRVLVSSSRPTMLGFGIEEHDDIPQVPTLPLYDGEIIIKPNSDAREERAAREIAHWVAAISGKRLPVLACSSNNDNLKIYIGKSFAQKQFQNDLKYLEKSDGFAVRKKGKNIYIFGDRTSGTLFGACRFIEKNSDLIWARPRYAFGTVYSHNPDLTFTETSFISRPSFQYRVSGHYQFFADGRIWQGRNGLNTRPTLNSYTDYECGARNSVLRVSFLGALKEVYSYDELKEKHSDFFALIHGKRRTGPHSEYICFSNSVVADTIATGITCLLEKARKKGKEIDTVSISIPDSWDVCACENCLKSITLANGGTLKAYSPSSAQNKRFFSTRMFMMMNRIAAKLEKQYPQITILTLAYIYLAEPPAVKLHKMISPWFCAYPTSNPRFPILDGTHNMVKNDFWQRYFQEWLNRNKVNKNLSLFTYIDIAGFSTFADAFGDDVKEMLDSGGAFYVRLSSIAKPDIPMDKHTNVFKREGFPWDYRAIENWVSTRLAWNGNLDPQALRKYYIERAFQGGAPEMQKFFDIIRNVWCDKGNNAFVNCHTGQSYLFNTFIVKTGHEKELRDLLVQAQSKAENPRSKELITHILKEYDAIAKGLDRTDIPFVAAITNEWDKPNSTFYLQGIQVKDFKLISTYKNFQGALAKHQTKASILRDNNYLYLKVDALDAAKINDKVEIILHDSEKNNLKFYFSVTRNGNALAMKNFKRDWGESTVSEWHAKVTDKKDCYSVTFRIPVNLFNNAKSIACKLIRIYEFTDNSLREESSASSFSIRKRTKLKDCLRLSLGRKGAK